MHLPTASSFASTKTTARPSRASSFSIDAISCPTSALRIEKQLLSLPEVVSVALNPLRQSATLVHYEEPATILKKLRAVGISAVFFPPSLRRRAEILAQSRKELRGAVIRFLLAAALCIPLWVPAFYLFIKGIWIWPVVGLAQVALWTRPAMRVLEDARARRLSSDLPLAVGFSVLTAYAAWSGWSGNALPMRFLATITALRLGAALWELGARDLTRRTSRKLAAAEPDHVNAVRGAQEIAIPYRAIQPDEEILLRSGETIPVDGKICEGNTLLDESLITGHRALVAKKKGDPVLAGSRIVGGSILVLPSAVSPNTVLSRMLDELSFAHASQPTVYTFPRALLRHWPVIVIAAAVGAGLFHFFGLRGGTAASLSAFLSVLFLTSGGFLSLPVVLPFSRAIEKGAEMGALFANARSVEKIARIDHLVFHKTGTITQGHPQVTDILNVSMFSDEVLFSILGGVEARIHHPLAHAVYDFAVQNGYAISEPRQSHALAGHGVIGRVQGSTISIGDEKVIRTGMTKLREHELLLAKLRDEGKTIFYAAVNGDLVSIIATADRVRPNTRAAVTELKSMGVGLAMCSGSSEATAAYFAHLAGVNEYISQATPARKAELVRKYRKTGLFVGMIGDGPHDDLAYAAADVSLGVGSPDPRIFRGTDATLIEGNLEKVRASIALARRAITSARLGLALSYSYHLCLVPLAWAGGLSPVSAAACQLAFQGVLHLVSLRVR